ncbi:hypothetical protein FHS14_004265 [Paenibacillus baekrokdamisoli]|uniref:hypothetical protein n=1 Tax=Paenibacillus baekrokdamisoli TaxID=1712516 RepID=UPI000F798EF8|nr:hypothetical protein [Paenibacillus baekrokdamisoli]MBB3071258.1 hypothetical protein [Paenibacillus baekrokdamisoli]
MKYQKRCKIEFILCKHPYAALRQLAGVLLYGGGGTISANGHHVVFTVSTWYLSFLFVIIEIDYSKK